MLRRPLHRLLTRLGLAKAAPPTSPEERARRLIAAIDAGGLPLDPALLNRMARDLGLEVSRRARPEDTVARLRAALARL